LLIFAAALLRIDVAGNRHAGTAAALDARQFEIRLEGAFGMSQGWRIVLILFASAALTHWRQPARAEDQSSQAQVPATAAESANPPSAAPPEKYKLEFKFRRNQVVHQEISHDFQLTTNKNQDTETARNSTKSKRHYQVVAVDAKTGIAELELTIDWVHMLASFDKGDGTPAEPIEFQSDDPKKHPKKFDDILSSIGKHDRRRFSPTGAPVKAPTQGPRRPEPAVTNVTDGNLEAHLFPLPEQAVAIGETWKERFDVRVKDDQQNLVLISLQRRYKLTEVKNGRAFIDCRTVILTPIQNPAVAAQFIEREITGTIEFDIEQGLIVSREWSVDKTLVGAVGANSSMRAISRYREKLLGSEATADRVGKVVPASSSKK
jgi:hypothetical protein